MSRPAAAVSEPSPLAALLTVNPGATAPVAQRSLRDYERAAGIHTLGVTR